MGSHTPQHIQGRNTKGVDGRKRTKEHDKWNGGKNNKRGSRHLMIMGGMAKEPNQNLSDKEGRKEAYVRGLENGGDEVALWVACCPPSIVPIPLFCWWLNPPLYLHFLPFFFSFGCMHLVFSFSNFYHMFLISFSYAIPKFVIFFSFFNSGAPLWIFSYYLNQGLNPIPTMMNIDTIEIIRQLHACVLIIYHSQSLKEI